MRASYFIKVDYNFKKAPPSEGPLDKIKCHLELHPEVLSKILLISLRDVSFFIELSPHTIDVIDVMNFFYFCFLFFCL